MRGLAYYWRNSITGHTSFVPRPCPCIPPIHPCTLCPSRWTDTEQRALKPRPQAVRKSIPSSTEISDQLNASINEEIADKWWLRRQEIFIFGFRLRRLASLSRPGSQFVIEHALSLFLRIHHPCNSCVSFRTSVCFLARGVVYLRSQTPAIRAIERVFKPIRDGKGWQRKTIPHPKIASHWFTV